MSKLVASSVASVTVVCSFRTSGYDTIFGLAIDIDEYIGTEDELDIDGDGEESDVKKYEF